MPLLPKIFRSQVSAFRFQVLKYLSTASSIKSLSIVCQLSVVSFHSRSRPGFVLLLGIIIITAVLILTTSQFDRVAHFVRFGSNKVMQQQALNLAEAGVDYALWQLNKNAGDWYGTATEVEVANTGTFFVTVTDDGPFKKIFSTGYIPNSTNP